MPIWVDGKRIDGNTNSTSKPVEVTEIAGIDAGEIFTHDGSVRVLGNIGKGAEVTIKNGGIVVEGDVLNKVKIKTRSAQNSTHITNNNISGSIISSNTIIINGNYISGDFSGVSVNGSDNSGINIFGHIGDSVDLNSDRDIKIKTAGEKLKVEGKRDFEASNLGSFATLRVERSIEVGDVDESLDASAGRDFKANNIGRLAYLWIGRDIKITGDVAERLTGESGRDFSGNNFGHSSKISCERDMRISSLSTLSSANSRRDFVAAFVAAGSTVLTGRDLRVREADIKATLTALRHRRVDVIAAEVETVHVAPVETPKPKKDIKRGKFGL